MDTWDFDTRLRPSMQSRPETQVAAPPQCIECSRPWLLEAERWRLKVLEDDEPETVLYCPDCHAREFE
jgi:hypothetical protein